jgi:tetratricopeptide (TPR) repeat protein
MHSVVHDWCFELFNEDSAQEMTQIVLIAVGQAVPYRDNLEDLILGRRLLSHATRYVQCTGYGYTSGGLMDELSIVLDSLFNLGVLFCDQGRLAEAEAMCQRALAGKEKALGLEHLLTLDTVYSLGVLFWNQGRLAEAEAMYQCALVGYEKALGPEHRSTLTTVHNLGILFRDQGRLAESEAIYQRTLSRKNTL